MARPYQHYFGNQFYRKKPLTNFDVTCPRFIFVIFLLFVLFHYYLVTASMQLSFIVCKQSKKKTSFFPDQINFCQLVDQWHLSSGIKGIKFYFDHLLSKTYNLSGWMKCYILSLKEVKEDQKHFLYLSKKKKPKKKKIKNNQKTGQKGM